MTYQPLCCDHCGKQVGVYPDELYAHAPVVYCSAECWSGGALSRAAVPPGSPDAVVGE